MGVAGVTKLTKLSDVIPFGKHKGETVRKVLDEDPGYLEWLMDNTKTTKFYTGLKIKIRDSAYDDDYYDDDFGVDWRDLFGSTFYD